MGKFSKYLLLEEAAACEWDVISELPLACSRSIASVFIYIRASHELSPNVLKLLLWSLLVSICRVFCVA